VKYAFIHPHRQVWPITVQCRVLQASVSGYQASALEEATKVSARTETGRPLRPTAEHTVAAWLLAGLPERARAAFRALEVDGEPDAVVPMLDALVALSSGRIPASSVESACRGESDVLAVVQIFRRGEENRVFTYQGDSDQEDWAASPVADVMDVDIRAALSVAYARNVTFRDWLHRAQDGSHGPVLH